MPKRKANAKWTGPVKEGSGTVALGSGAFEGPYSFKSRFEEGDQPGTNPEELIGAAHAGCFAMALSNVLTEAEPRPTRWRSRRSSRSASGGDISIPAIKLTLEGKVPGIDEAAFQEAANAAKEGCPVSKALAGVDEITLDAKLVS